MSDEQRQGNGLQFCQPRTTFHLLLSCCNRYSYALNNPTTLTDPTGLDPDTCTTGDQSGLCATTTGTSFGPDQCIDSDGTAYCNQIDESGPGDPLIGEYYEWEMCGFMGDCNYQPVGGGTGGGSTGGGGGTVTPNPMVWPTGPLNGPGMGAPPGFESTAQVIEQVGVYASPWEIEILSICAGTPVCQDGLALGVAGVLIYKGVRAGVRAYQMGKTQDNEWSRAAKEWAHRTHQDPCVFLSSAK